MNNSIHNKNTSLPDFNYPIFQNGIQIQNPVTKIFEEKNIQEDNSCSRTLPESNSGSLQCVSRTDFHNNSDMDFSEDVENQIPFLNEAINNLKKNEFIGKGKKEELIIKVEDKFIQTKISFERFTKDIRSFCYRDNKINFIPCSINSSLVIYPFFSNKRKREDIQIYFDHQKVLGKGALGVVRKIVRVGKEKNKAMKLSLNSCDKKNKELEIEAQSMKSLHDSLPVDPALSRNGNGKHLGIQNAFKTFGMSNEQKQCLIGKCYEGDGKDLIIQNRREALVTGFQLLFALKILDDKKKFNHDIKNVNALFLRDESFPLHLKVDLSDLACTSEEEILQQLQQHKIPLDFPFGSYTPKYMPKKDMELLKQIIKKFYNFSPLLQNTEDLKNELLKEIIEIRKKNMVSLLGQAIFTILTKKHYEEFTYENINTDLLQAPFMREVNGRLSFCSSFSNLMFKMTKTNYKERLMPEEALSEFIGIIKQFDEDLYQIIVKNKWTDGYADWLNNI